MENRQARAVQTLIDDAISPLSFRTVVEGIVEFND
jgi:hypothetical protein